jgi:outer membrane protein TolC
MDLHASDNSSVSLKELLEALQHHPSVRLSENALRVSGFNLDNAKWSKYPTFSVDGIAPVDSDKTLTFKVEQPLWTAGRSNALIGAAKAEVSSAQVKVTESIDLLEAEVIAAYIELWRAQEKVIASNETIGELKELSNIKDINLDKILSK